jgi:sirohydrochlorin ferrochelatase
MTPFETAIFRIDAANAEDPNTVMVDGGAARPAELLYSERMSAMLGQLVPEASEALRLAARAQHLRRWTIPRGNHPMDRAGYHRWRAELKRRHADWASAILTECGIDPETVPRVASLIRKENLKTDVESQTLEDVACLVFLQFYAADFAPMHEREKMIGIVQKTWKKMSEEGHAAALALPLAPSVRAIVDEALATTARPMRARVALGDVAVVLAAHGDRGGESPNATLLRHCAALRADGAFHSVSAGILRGEPALEDSVRTVIASGAKCLAVYPMFMAEGYFTRKVLTQRLAAMEIPIDVHVLPPLGADPSLPDLMRREALAAAEMAGMAAASARLLIVGHGSKIGPASAEATRAVAAMIARAAGFASVETAFLEEAEFLEDALRRGAGQPTVVSGFFSGDGLHAAEDVPEAIVETGAKAVYAGSVGTLGAIPRMIRLSLTDALGGP